MKRTLAAAVLAVLLLPPIAARGQEADSDARFDPDVQPVAFMARVFGRSRVGCATQAPSCTTRACPSPGCATKACPPSCGCETSCASKCSRGLIPALRCRMQSMAGRMRCARSNCTGCASCAAPACAAPACTTSACTAPACASRSCGVAGCGGCGFSRLRSMRYVGCGVGTCETPACCGDEPCKNYWGSYCYEKRPSLIDSMRNSMACKRARRCGCGRCATGRCATGGCATGGCATGGCACPGCATAPSNSLKSPFMDDSLKSPFMDDDDLAPPVPPVETSYRLPGKSPATRGNAAQPQHGLRPTPGEESLRPLSRLNLQLQSYRAATSVSRTAHAESIDSIEENARFEAQPAAIGSGLQQPTVQPAMQPLNLTAMTRRLENGAQLTFNPYCGSEASAPRRLLPAQEAGNRLDAVELEPAPLEVGSYPETSATTPATNATNASNASNVTKTTALQPVERVSAEIGALPATIRFITPANSLRQ